LSGELTKEGENRESKISVTQLEDEHNEKFHIPNFYRGIESICLFFEKLGQQ
jgi:hypothetical protein